MRTAHHVEFASSCWWDGLGEYLYLCDLDFLLSCDGGRDTTLVVSHPHGKPKKITMGQERGGIYPLVECNAATCPGSSGAPLFRCYTNPDVQRYILLSPPVYSGSSTSTSTQHRNQPNLLTNFPRNLRDEKLPTLVVIVVNSGTRGKIRLNNYISFCYLQ